MKQVMNLFKIALIGLILVSFQRNAVAATKTSTGNGNWNSNTTWSPSGVPSSSDDVIIASGHSPNLNINNAQCRSLTIQTNGTLIIGSTRKLTVNNISGIIVNGTLNINNGDITISNANTNFTVNAGASVIWSPGVNTLAGATLFTNCIENFNATSTLTIKKWYNLSVGLGSVVSSNFGNVIISGVSGTWQMQNSLQSRRIFGTLTITSSYVVLDNTGSISNTTIGDIVLTNSSSFLDFYNGTHPGTFTVNTGNISITGGELDCFYNTGTGTCNFNITGNMTLTSNGYFIGCNGHNGNLNINITGNVQLTRSLFIGINSGSGNNTINITGDLTTQKGGSTYSEFYSIIDGNGNSNLSIGGSFNNQGYFDLIWNTGVTGVGNGNATMNIGGTFRQSDGDFRGIWNATTSNSGSCSITIDTIDFTGGIFMATYSIAQASVNHNLTIAGQASIAFGNPTDIFRGNGLATLGASQNNSSFTLSSTGPIYISGNTSAELSPNAGYGNESITLGSTFSISGGIVTFGLTNHAVSITGLGALNLSGGTLYLSKSSGDASISIAENLMVSGGILNLKNNTGKTTATITGNLTFSNGTISLYSNNSIASNDSTKLIVNGDFNHSAGTFQFSNNTGNLYPTLLYLNGNNFNLSGTGTITSAGAGSSNYFGTIIFNNQTNTNYNRNSATHHIEQVKYVLNTSSKVEVITGPMELSSGTNNSSDYLTINNGAILTLGTNIVQSNALSTYSGLTVNDGGTLKTAHTNGLYNGTTNAAISSGNNMNYFLSSSSTILYNGSDNQRISGYGNGIANSTQHLYGNLTIDFSGSPDAEYCYLERNTTVRGNISPLAGELLLNGFTLTAETATVSATGYIKSEENNAINNSKLKLAYTPTNKNIQFPFGKSSTILIPVTVNITNNPGSGYITISTRASGTDNTPLPGAENVSAISSINPGGSDVSTTQVIDRWWEVNASGVVADFTLSYAGSENTTTASVSGGNFNIQYWNGSTFNKITSTGLGVTTGVGSITASLNNITGPLVLSSGSASLPIKLLQFEAKANGTKVDLVWSTAEEKNNDYFTIERSVNGIEFEKVVEIKGAGNSTTTLHYHSFDLSPLEGISYYRLKQTDYNGQYSFSPIRLVNRSTQISSSTLTVMEIGPNPFRNKFTIHYNLQNPGETKFILFNLSGQIVFETSQFDNSGANNFEFTDEKSLPPGTYILNVINGTEKITKKLIKTVN